MPTFSQLKLQAIAAAKAGQWDDALAFNLTALEQNPDDLGTLNRLGISQLSLGQKKAAKETFERVLTLDKTNQLAQKNLHRLKGKTVPSLLFSNRHFIEEPGKTKVVELHRLASKPILVELRVGTACVLKTKKRYISVEANDSYIGALPEDLSFRMTKLMESGNQYEAAVWAASATSCSVFLKEIHRSASNADIASFPCLHNQQNHNDDFDPLLSDEYILDSYPDEETEPTELIVPME